MVGELIIPLVHQNIWKKQLILDKGREKREREKKTTIHYIIAGLYPPLLL